MRVCYAILLLMPLVASATLPKGKNSEFSIQNSAVRTNASSLAKNQEPRTKNPSPSPAPATKNQEPRTKNQEPSPTWTPSPFTRYDPILSRMPFGVPPPPAPAPAAVAAPAPPPPAFVSKLVLCALNRTPAGTVAVGFVDGSQNPPHSYVMDEGETLDGFTVVSTDFDQELATLEKDGLSIDLKMGKGPTVGTAKPTPVAAPIELAQASPPANMSLSAPSIRPSGVLTNSPTVRADAIKERLRNRIFASENAKAWPVPANVKSIDAVLDMGIQQDSYVERLKKRREELIAQEAENKAQIDKDAEAKAAAAFTIMLRKRNVENIQQGGTGLGIPLTAEEDNQLVKDGFLPAR